MSIFSSIKSPEFRKAALRILLVYALIIGTSWFYLRWYTDHGEFISVPDMKGMALEEAIASLDSRGLEYLVIDSIYDRKASPGTIVDQSPIAESQVKEGRQVFLTIYRINPPMEKLGVKQGDYAAVAMIKLKNKSIDFDTLYEDNNMFPGSIIRVVQKGKSLKADSQIPRGAKVTLVIGRAASTRIIVPDFYGKTCNEVQAILDTLNLACNCRFEPGIASPSAQDSATFRVCRQDPVHDPTLGTTPGRIVDLWLYSTPCPKDPDDD